MALLVEDYGLLGDTQTAAPVGRDGSIDWLLLSEEYDQQSGRRVGNFPQAFSHVPLINTARNLSADGGPSHQREKTTEAGQESAQQAHQEG